MRVFLDRIGFDVNVALVVGGGLVGSAVAPAAVPTVPRQKVENVTAVEVADSANIALAVKRHVFFNVRSTSE